MSRVKYNIKILYCKKDRRKLKSSFLFFFNAMYSLHFKYTTFDIYLKRMGYAFYMMNQISFIYIRRKNVLDYLTTQLVKQ